MPRAKKGKKAKRASVGEELKGKGAKGGGKSSGGTASRGAPPCKAEEKRESRAESPRPAELANVAREQERDEEDVAFMENQIAGMPAQLRAAAPDYRRSISSHTTPAPVTPPPTNPLPGVLPSQALTMHLLRQSQVRLALHAQQLDLVAESNRLRKVELRMLYPNIILPDMPCSDTGPQARHDEVATVRSYEPHLPPPALGNYTSADYLADIRRKKPLQVALGLCVDEGDFGHLRRSAP